MSALVVLGLAAGSGFAQTADQLELTESIIQTERKALIATNLGMTEPEAEVFWPIYNKYDAELRGIRDRRIRTIRRFAQEYETLTDDQADALIKEFYKEERDLIKVRRKYIRRFKKALPPTRLLRFYQVENKLKAIIDYELAAAIPLAR